MSNVDWTSFGIPSKTQRRILANLCEVLKCEFGEVRITIKDGRIIDIIKEERERMDLREGEDAKDR